MLIIRDPGEMPRARMSLAIKREEKREYPETRASREGQAVDLMDGEGPMVKDTYWDVTS